MAYLKKFADSKISTQWIKVSSLEESCFVGSNAVAFGLGSHLILTNLTTGKDLYYRANGITSGDGINCIAGHKIFEIFAIAEKGPTNRILVITYPDFKIIATLSNEQDTAPYLSLAFSEKEHLIALTGLPDYKLQVWYWRTEELVAVRETNIFTDKQIIGISPTSPLVVCQIAFRRMPITVWEIHGAGKFTEIIQRTVTLPTVKDENLDFTFSIDGSLNVINVVADVYQINTTTADAKRIIEWTGESGVIKPQIAYFKGGLIISGPDGTFKHFTKKRQQWVENMTFQPPDTFLSIRCFESKEELYGVTQNGVLMKLTWDAEVPTFIRIKQYERAFTFFILLNPLGHYVVTSNKFDMIEVLHIETGEHISSIKFEKYTKIRGHPFYPIVIIGDSKGIVYVLSLVNPKEPKILTEFHLSHSPITNIVFVRKGVLITIRDMDGNFFVIEGLPGTHMNILRHFNDKTEFIDMIVAEFNYKLYIHGLELLENEKSLKTDRLVQIIVDLHTSAVANKTTVYSLPQFYIGIAHIADEHKKIFLVPHLSTEVQIVELGHDEEEKDVVNVIETVYTFHQIKYIQAHSTSSHLLTWGIDGVVSVFDVRSRKLMITFVVHHRLSSGVKRAYCDPLLQYIVSTGFSGNMICTKKTFSPIDPKRLETLQSFLKNPQFMAMANQPTIGYKPTGENEGKSYLEIIEQTRIQKEKELSTAARDKILNEFDMLREKIKVLLANNEKAPPEEVLPLQAFNLNKEAAALMVDRAAEERKAETQRINKYIATQSIIIDRLKAMCWQKSEIKPVKLRGIFTKLNVENYPIMAGESSDKQVKEVLFWRTAEILASSEDTLHPWNPMGTLELESLLGKRPRIHEQARKSVFHEGDAQRTEYTLPNYYLPLSGTSTHKFVEIFPLRCQQMEVVAHNQVVMENILAKYDIYKLRVYFNKIFRQMEEIKSQEMKLVLLRNERLRKIQDEINILSELRQSVEFADEIIMDPIFYPDEKPSSIVEVEQHEVPVLPYISPSMQKALDAEAAERERIRLEKLADDFKERALNAMMDGVLEKLWEDEIKKMPPKPECLTSEKDPGEYTAEDLRDIQDYEDAVAHIKAEREKYRQMLYAERDRLHSNLLDQIQKFNSNVGQTLLTKMKVEASICQEELKLLQHVSYLHQRLYHKKAEVELKSSIDKLIMEINKLEANVVLIREQKDEISRTYEFFRSKDALLDKDFKLHFGENLTSSILNQAMKLYKKRPIVKSLIAFTVPTLLDISKRVVNKNYRPISALMPPEVQEILTALDALDAFSNAPPGLDAAHWERVCQFRRIKMESEYRLKSYGEMLADAEGTAQAFHREIHAKKNLLLHMEHDLENLIKKREDGMLNRNVHIVIKKGLVEVPLTGSIGDFTDCILIHRSDVEDINIIIKKAGLKKLAAMKHAAVFRRKVMVKEYDHKILKMRVRDMKDTVATIEKCKITKEVQLWLKRKEKGWPDDLGPVALARDIKVQIDSQERILSENMKLVKEMDLRIEEKMQEANKIDKKVQALNILVSEKNLKRDVKREKKEQGATQLRMREIILRSNLVERIQKQHAQIIELNTVLEFQRLKTYPTLTSQPHNPNVTYRSTCPNIQYKK